MTRAGVLAGLAAVLLLVATPVVWSRTGSAARPGPAEVAAGQVVFHTKGCSSCHTGPDSQGHGDFPNLSDARSWAGRRRPGLSAEEYLRQSIVTPSVFTSPAWKFSGGPTPGMPQLSVSEQEVDALVAYLLAAH